MAAETSSAFSSPMKKCKRKRKRTQLGQELEHLDSLSWKPSFPTNDPLSLFIGSSELEGGFLSLEEIDEVQYGFKIPELVMGSNKFEKTTTIMKKQDNDSARGNECEGSDKIHVKVEENMEHEGNVETTQRREKNKNSKEIQEKEKVAGDVDDCSSNEPEVKVDEKMGEENNVEKSKKRKKKNTKKGTGKTPEHLESVVGSVDGSSSVNDGKADTEKNMVIDNNLEKKKKKKNLIETNKEDEELTFANKFKNESEAKPVDETEYYAWNELRLHPLLMNSIFRLGFKEPTPIQKACIPAAAHQGKDVVGAAETGSGKTLAFGLPILQRLLEEEEKAGRIMKGKEEKDNALRGLRALIITPTRELALQVTNHLKAVAEGTNTRVVPIVGGMSTEKQERLLRGRPEIIVGTPGRLWELMSGGEKHLVEMHMLSFFVLDEADRMIENGHFHQLQSIVDMLPATNSSNEGNSQSLDNGGTTPNVQRKKRQTFVFSATLSLASDFRKKLKRSSQRSKQSGTGDLNSIENLSERAGMRENVAIIDLTNSSILVHKLEESFIECREEDKDAYLYYILSVHGQGRTIVFCTSIAALRRVSALLAILGVNAYNLHAQKQQRSRLKAIDRFRSMENSTLIATDVAARGLDIPGVRTVIHYQLPHSAEVYVHRSGRTARASADGCSIALISPNETYKFASLCKSFSKESFRQFPFDNSYIPGIMKRLSLARQIDKIMRKGSQEKSRKSWLEKNAESVEFDVGEDDSEEETVNNHKQRKAVSMQLKNLQQDLNNLLSRPLQPETFSHRYLAGAGVSPLLQNQFEELARQKFGGENTGGKKRKNLMVIGQNCVEPLEALKGSRLQKDIKENAGQRRNIQDLRRKRKQEKIGLRDERRRQRKRKKGEE